MKIDGTKIRDYREEHGITIDEMAEMLNMDGETLYEYESGVIDWYEEDSLTIYIINSLLEGLDFISVDIDELYEEYGL